MCRSVDLCGFLDRNFPVQIRLTVHPSEGSTRLGIIKIKVFVRRSRRSRDDGRETLNLGKVLAYMCKETTPVLQEQVEKLRSAAR